MLLIDHSLQSLFASKNIVYRPRNTGRSAGGGLVEFDIGQIVGILANISPQAVAVVSLFVAVEVQQNGRLLEAQSRYSLKQYRPDMAEE